MDKNEPTLGYILGIDPGMSRCGWGILRYNRDDPTETPTYFASGVWETAHSKGESIWAKSRELITAITETFAYCDTHLAMPNRVAVELPAYGAAYSSHNVSHCRGLLAVLLRGYELEDVIDIASSEVKRRAAGGGNSGKDAVSVALSHKIDGLRYQTKWLDESDALAVAYSAWHQNTDGFQSNAPNGT